jgi:hypothetical protein
MQVLYQTTPFAGGLKDYRVEKANVELLTVPIPLILKIIIRSFGL